MELPPLLELKGRQAALHLVDPALTGDTLTAQGYSTPDRLRKGRVFRLDGERYELLQGLEPGTKCTSLNLDSPVVLARRT